MLSTRLSMPIFVVHEHHTARRHWDFRLELEGVLKSWAMPKQPPKKAGIKRLSIQVDDHELQYADFEGEIPQGEYGAGVVRVWDRGVYRLLVMNSNGLKLELFGSILKGKYVLCRFPNAGEKDWLFFKIRDVRANRRKSQAGG